MERLLERRGTAFRPGWLVVTLLMLVAFAAVPVHAAEPDAAGVEFFEKRIRPLLAEHCYRCHGDEKQESDLRMDSLEGIREGGASGAALLTAEPSESLLLAAVRYEQDDLQMPPDGKLSDEQIADLARWLALGAPHPDRDKPSGSAPVRAKSDFWSFQPPVDPPLPTVQNGTWPRVSLDYFVLAQLEAQGLHPAPPADRRTLLRRATYDLTGLPPTPAEVQQFLADPAADDVAFAKVVERLLASPRYGERWGRHWLDVARYADSNGLDENIAHGNAWRYRDYVVRSFNQDKPYDEFVQEQLAGDLLPADDEATRYEHLIATGFLSLGPKVLAEVDETKMEMDIVDEQVDTVGRAFMGLTLGCARCHDHKFDPIATTDYYALAGIFKSTRTMEHFTKIAKWYENPIPGDEDKARQAEHEQQVAAQQAKVDSLVKEANERLRAAAEDGALPDKPEEHYSDETKAQLKQLREELASLKAAAPEMPSAMGATEGDVTDLRVHVRGSHLTLGETVPRRFPTALAGTDQPPMPADRSGRLRLAEWLVADDHPLTARVMANRIWRWHFGEGLVPSPDNFGQLGDRPTNQPLLDHLAVQFRERSWSIKQMHRWIMLSSTYRMSSQYDAEAARVDPENRLLWRSRLRRLEAEAIRDSMLQISGMLDTGMGGSLLHVKNREFIFNHTSEDKTTYDSRRRSLYLPVVRNHLYDVFQLFDYTDASTLTGDRATTTIAPQALFMLNGKLMIEAADQLAARLMREAETDEQRIGRLFQLAYSRQPEAGELQRAQQFLQQFAARLQVGEVPVADRQDQPHPAQPEDAAAASADERVGAAEVAKDPQQAALSALCQAIMAANEFVYLQ